MPKNWITYTAGALAIAYGIIGAIFNLHDAKGMVDYLITGLGVVGFRRAMAKNQVNN